MRSMPHIKIDATQAHRIREKTGEGIMDIKKALEYLSVFGDVEDEVVIAYIRYNGHKLGVKSDYDYDYKVLIQKLKKYDRLEIAYYNATDKEKALISIIDSF